MRAKIIPSSPKFRVWGPPSSYLVPRYDYKDENYKYRERVANPNNNRAAAAASRTHNFEIIFYFNKFIKKEDYYQQFNSIKSDRMSNN